jgi:hypothetical protein
VTLTCYHDFYFDPKDQSSRVERGWWVLYFGGPSACCWLVPGTLEVDL